MSATIKVSMYTLYVRSTPLSVIASGAVVPKFRPVMMNSWAVRLGTTLSITG
jgi:hypothetical protein